MDLCQRDGDRPERADTDDADRFARLDLGALETLQDDGARLDEHGSVERHVLREPVHDPGRHDDELAVAAPAREADRVVVPAQLRLARIAARARQAGDVALAHDALAGLEAGDSCSHRVDGAAPLVAGNDGEAHPARVEDAADDVEIRPANAGTDAASAHFAGAGRRRLDLAKRDVVRSLDDDCPHRGVKIVRMRLEQALVQLHFVLDNASAPVSVAIVDDHGEVIAAASMDGAAPDTRLNAERKAYTAARSDATSTRELAAKAREDATERASL